MVLNIFQRLELLVLGGLDFKHQLLVHLSLAAATFCLYRTIIYILMKYIVYFSNIV